MTVTARPPSPAGIRPAALAGVLLGDLIAPAAPTTPPVRSARQSCSH
jgi:hypothetical protein